MKMEVSFPGGARVHARFKGHTLATDQPVKDGGDDSAPAPFDVFLASLATCTGYYALQFCKQREISTEGLGVSLEVFRDEERKRVGKLRLEIRLPQGFPEKYRQAIVRAADQCAVKRHILEPPEFEIEAL